MQIMRKVTLSWRSPTWNASILGGNQLLGAANLQISAPSGQVTTRYEGELSNKNEINRQLSVKSHQANICQQL